MKAAPHDSDEQTCAMCKAFMAILSNEIKDTKNQVSLLSPICLSGTFNGFG